MAADGLLADAVAKFLQGVADPIVCVAEWAGLSA
jgi:hypothetical protein